MLSNFNYITKYLQLFNNLTNLISIPNLYFLKLPRTDFNYGPFTDEEAEAQQAG